MHSGEGKHWWLGKEVLLVNIEVLLIVFGTML